MPPLRPPATPARSTPVTNQRDRWILELTPLVSRVARNLCRRLPAHVDPEDLFQDGILGLMEAIDRFEPSRARSLVSFAEFRIRGAMLDGLRRDDWVPRAVRRNRGHLEHARSELAQRLGHEPSAEEMADGLGMTLGSLSALQERARTLELISMDAAVDGDGSRCVSDFVASTDEGAEERLQQAELHARLASLVQELPPEQVELLRLHFGRGLSLRRTGAELGLSEGRVARLRRDAISALQQSMEQAA